MGDSEGDKCHLRTHVRGELNLEKEEFGKRAGEGREGREKWDKRKERMEGVKDEEEGRQREKE